jgi:hypothetical protein
MLAIINALLTIDEKSKNADMEVNIFGQVCFAATCTSNRKEEGEAVNYKKIHKRPTSNHKLIYICLPDKYRDITKIYYEL